MKISYKDVINKMQYNSGKKDQGYNMPLFPSYNSTVGNIIPGKFTVVAGGPSSGRTSFVDSVYVMNVLLQWYNSEERPPLKIFYFSMVDNQMKKIQSLLCSYLMMVESIRMDLPTLNSQPGRLFDLDKKPVILSAIDDSEKFFSELETNEVLEIIDGAQPPSEIYGTIMEYMDSIGDDDPKAPYELHDKYKNGLVMLIVDSVDNMVPEFDGYGRTAKDDLNNKLIKHIAILSKRYDVNSVIITSTDVGFTRTSKETIPTIKHLGVFNKKCDIGIIIYNPILEGTRKFLLPNDENRGYVSNGRNVLRFWFVVRNTNGADSFHQRFLFLPGSGYSVEFPMTGDQVTEFDDIYEVLMETPSPYN